MQGVSDQPLNRRTTYIAPGATVHIGGTGQTKILRDYRLFDNYGTLYVDGTNTAFFRIGNGADANRG